MSLLPSRGPDTSGSQDGELQVVGVDEDVSAILDALSSDTAREILNAVYDDPGTPSDLADRLDMSIQKVSYHLEKLEDEELIAVAGTQYSEKGQEMTVYEPPEDPLVLFVGTPERKHSLRSLVRRLIPAIGILTAASLVVQLLLGELPFNLGDTASETGGGDAGAPTEPTPTPAPEATPSPTAEPTPTPTPDGGGIEAGDATEAPTSTPAPEPTPTPTPEATSTPTEVAMETTRDLSTTVQESGGAAAVDIAPGLAFFLGGLFVIAVFATVWAYGEYV
jgi:DNA-binding transcriptional ArsR family regulator